MYYDSIRYGAADTEVGCIYIRAFMFSFKQLNVDMQANRLIISTARWRKILLLASQKLQDEDGDASSSLVAQFSPLAKIELQGLWAWSLVPFADLAASPMLRTVHCAFADCKRIAFVYR